VLFSPGEIGGSLYVDGGLLDNLPYRPLVDKCDKVIAVDIFRGELNNEIKSMFDVAVRTFELSVSINREDAEKSCAVLIQLHGLGNINIIDNSQSERVYEIGYEACMDMKNEILNAVD
jgi:NTE family protein